MNICMLSKSMIVHQMGGMEIHARGLSELAAAMGHTVTVITTRHPKGEIAQEEINKVVIHYLPTTKMAHYSSSWWRESAKKITQLHKRSKFDIVWAESFSGYYYAWKIKGLINVPILSILQGGGFIGSIMGQWRAVSSIRELFVFLVKSLPEYIFLGLPLFWRTLRYSDGIVCVSNESAKVIKREFFTDPEKIFVVYNSVDTDIFKPDQNKRKTIREKYSIDESMKVILMSGVIHKQKGMHIGLKAFLEIKKKISNSKMIIVGDGPQLDSLKRLANSLNIGDDVIFCGLVPNAELPLYYNAADILLNPTLRDEGLPIVIVEAMACGLPIVTSRVGGTPSTIDDGVSGFFVGAKDSVVLATKTIEILSSPERMAQFSRSAREKVLRRFDRKIWIKKYLEISQEVING